MNKTKERVLSAMLVTSMIASASAIPTIVMADTSATATVVSKANTITTHRLAGEDRYSTAIAIAEKGFDSATTVVIASGENFADALVAGPLARKYNAPILLSAKTGLDKDTLTEISKLGAKTIIIVGGVGVLSNSLETQLTSEGIGSSSITRFGGSTRYETSVLIAQKLDAPTQVVVASGDNFPDALSMDSIASKLNMPIILTAKEGLTDNAKAFIASIKPTKTYIIGGTGVIDTVVESQVANPVRISGADRYATNLAVLKQFAGLVNYDSVYTATGNEFADALAGTALASSTASPMVLVDGAVNSATEDYLKAQMNVNTKVVALGGTAVVADTVIKTITDDKASIKAAKVFSVAGTYGDTVTGNAIITADGISLKDATISGDLLIASTVNEGTVYLDNVKIGGKIIINGGGEQGVEVKSMTTSSVTMDKPIGNVVRLATDASSNIGTVIIDYNGTVDNSLSPNKPSIIVSTGATVTLKGNFNSVNITGVQANVNLVSGTVNTLTVSPGGAGAIVNTSDNTTITNLNILAKANIKGTATITNANIGSNNVIIEPNPKTVAVTAGVTANVGGITRDSSNSINISTVPTTEPVSTGGTASGSGGGGSATTATTVTTTSAAIIAVINPADITVSNGTTQSSIVLPTTVGVRLSDGTTTTKSVTNWRSTTYNALTAGTYTFTGDVADTITKAAINVIVKAASVVPDTDKPVITSVRAINGTITATLSSTPAAPVIGDFTVTQTIGVKAATQVTPTAISTNGAIVILTVPIVAGTSTDQSVTYAVSYQGTTAISASAFTVQTVVNNHDLSDGNTHTGDYVISTLGTFGLTDATKTTTINGNVSINYASGLAADSITLQNLNINGTLTVDFGAGSLILYNVKVNGVNISNVGSH